MTEWRSTGFVQDSDEEDEPGSFVTESPPNATGEDSTYIQSTVWKEVTADQSSESEARRSTVIAGKDVVYQPAQVAKENDGEEQGQDVTMQDHGNVVEPGQKPCEALKLPEDRGNTAEVQVRDDPRRQINEREPKDVAMEDVAAEESFKKPDRLDSSDNDADMDELALGVPLLVPTGVTQNVPRKSGPSRRTKTYGKSGPKQKLAKASQSHVRKETEESRAPQDVTVELPRPGCNIVEVVVQRVRHDASMDQADEPSLSIHHKGPTQVAPMGYIGDLEDLANETTVELSCADPFEIPSSPLSTPPMSPVINKCQELRPFHGIPDELPNFAPPRSGTQEVIAQRSISNRGPSATGQDAFVNGLASRTLRTRKAIQLHPYLIEGEQYRKTLRSRGLRPIQVAVGSQRTNGVEAAETQNQSFDFNDDSQTTAMLESSPLALSSSQNTSSRSSSPPVVPAAPPLQLSAEEDDEFPDLDVVLNRTIVAGVQQGYKRRKTTHTHAAHDTHNRSADETARQRSAVLQPASGVTTADCFEVPPSPPPTSSTSGPLAIHEIEDTAFKVPRGFSPLHMPTPLASSETQPFGRVIIEELSETDSVLVRSFRPRSRKQPRRALTVESSSEESSVESEHDDSQLRRARKRIKGVLPASWLKLDRQAQIKTTNVEKIRVESTASPLRLMPQKGVAQRISAAGRRSRSHSLNTGNIADVVAILDGSDSSESLVAARKPAVSRQARLSISGSYVDSIDDRAGPTDAMEDNWIDPMLPSASRYKSGKANCRKQQLQLPREFAYASNGVSKATHPVSAHTDATRRGRPGAQLGGLRHTTKARARKPTVPRLSILDAPKSPSQSSHPTPLFLRIATRQARRQSDQGRHSPTGKYMRLQTRQDTEDAKSTLRAWREGAIVASRTRSKTRDDIATHSAEPPLVLDADHSASSVGHRSPLQKLRDNQQQRRLPSPTKQHSVAVGDQRTSHGDQAQARVGSARRANPVLRQSRLKPMVVKTSGLLNPVSVPSSRQPLPPASRPSHRRPRPRQAIYRDAQLETLEANFADKHRRAAFHTNLQRVNRAFQHRFDSPAQPDFQLARFLHDEDAVGSSRQTEPANPEFTPAAGVQGGTGLEVSIVRRPRKRATHRIDADAIEYRQPSEPMPVDDGTVSVVSEPPNSRTQPTLRGLGAFSTRYPVDFDVHPLELGTYFHQSTLIGSGDFDDSLSLRGRDLDVPAGHISIQCNNKNMQWCCWTDEVASDLSTVFSFISIQLQACTRLQQPHELDHQATSAAPQITYLLRSVVRYLSGCLSFLDPVDRRSCVVRVFHILGDLLHNTLASTGNAPAAQQVSTSTGQLLTRTMLFILVLARQVLQVANHPSVKASVKSDIEGLILSTARQLIGTIVRPSTSQIRDFLEKNRRHLFREAGIGDEDLSVEVVVITAHTLTKASIAGHGIWTMINEVLTKRMERVHRVQVLDRIWQDLFIVLPLLEIDASGLLRVGRRFENSMEDWTMIKTLLSCLFAAYSETSRAQSCTMNAYIRAVLNRCHCLVQSWGWRRCEIMLSTVFDFFARNGLAQLHLEGSRGSPRFLEHLDQDLHLTVDPEDRAFHIFLKILATGLKGMRGSYTDQKIRGIAWRFIPNHGRMYRKDEAVRQEELDALRNHHDLLCTLYWSSPVGFRPRTDLLRNLVDHSTSHREACRLNVRSWANLVKYQLSTDEAVSALGPFALWHREIVDVTIAQYKLARTEAESQFEAARIRGTLNISNELLQSTISTNQRQVLATLSDAILAMREAIRIAKSEAASSALLLSSSVMEVFSLLDAKNVSVNAAIAEALSIVPEYLNLVEKLQGQAESQRHSEESQDYGDWSGFEEVAADPGYGHTTDGFFNFIHEPLSQLLSNCFGSEVTPEDALLAKVVDSWTLIARRMVHSGKKGWNHYLDSYSPNSWHQLRDTEQTRKFAAYFMLSVIDADHHSYEIHGPDFISSWLISLVERESMLKFQHRLTSVLLNVDPANPLLRNLPFTADPVTDSYGIDLHTLRERRLGLIASVLSNMRESFDDALHDNPSSVLELRREYTSYLKQMMAAMKKNYQELQGSRALTADTTNGAYVSFVQRIVEFLQQHTSDICPVDRFFTDSAAFPLPATDPTYVVGRLKAYGLKLYDARTRKQLAVFIQSVSERASVDGQQPYLVGQLSTAMCGLYERGDRARPSLRYFLITAVFPAYVELSYKSPCGWILAKPILQASREVLDDLVYDYSITDPASVEAVVAIVTTTLGVLRQAVELLIDHSELLEQPHSLSVLAVMFQVVTATLLNVHYIHRRTNSARSASLVENSIKHIDFFRSFSLFVASTLLGHQDAPATILEDHIPDTTDNAFADVREFCSRELVAAMGKAWVKHDGQYFVLRGKDRKEVVVRTRTLDGEKKRVVEAIEEFHGVLDRISGLGVNEEEEEVSRGVGWLAGVFV